MPALLPPSPTALLVACLCANWCGTCRDYRVVFDQLAVKFPDTEFLWIDIEDEADLVDPIEVEDFPTILIASPTHALFFGTVTPHMQTLQRLIEAHHSSSRSPLPPDTDLNDLIDRLWKRVPHTR